jgi:hypothetical protein
MCGVWDREIDVLLKRTSIVFRYPKHIEVCLMIDHEYQFGLGTRGRFPYLSSRLQVLYL